MYKNKALKKTFSLLFAFLFTLLTLLSPLSSMVAKAEEGEEVPPTGDLAQYAVNEVGQTDQGWVIYASEDPNYNPMTRASGSSGMSVSKDYGGYTSYTQIVTAQDDAGVEHIAYCVEPDKNTPNGTSYIQQVMDNAQLRTVLYYGYGGPGEAELMAMEGGNVNNAYMDTWIAARLAYGESSSNPAWAADPCVSWLLNHAQVEVGSLTVNGSPETSWNRGEKIQETEWYTTAGSGTFSLELDGLGITAKLSDGRTVTGTTSGIPVGTSFKLCAGPEKEGTVTVPIKTTGVAYTSMLFIPSDDPNVQSIVAGVAGTGQGQDTSASAIFKKRPTIVKVIKTDDRHLVLNLDKMQPSGDASLDGAIFGIYKDRECTQKVGEATVTNGKADFGNLILGDYFIREIAAGNGYQVNDQVYPISVWDENIEGVTEVANAVKTNPVSIVKYAITDPDNVDDVLNPLANVDFTLTLKSAIDKGEKLTEGDNLFSGKTDENGRIRWENVPVGTYVLHEVKTPEGFIPIDDLIVVVDGSGEEIEIPLTNKMMYGDLIIVKKDSETQKEIPVSGVKFKVIDLATMQFVKQSSAATLFIPTDTFKTNDEGKLSLPKKLKSGSYAVVEVSSPDGYLTAGLTASNNTQKYMVDGKEYQGIPVTISPTTCDKIEIDGKTEYSSTISVYDQPAKGRIEVTKTGDQLDGTKTTPSKYGNVTEFIFNEKALKGTVFEVYADEDITTPDGTVRLHKGDLADTLTTGDNGKAITKDLYLGKYKVVEKSAPEGFVNAGTEQKVTLKYKGETVQASDNVENTTFHNDRQNVEFQLTKLEQEIDKIEQEGDGVTIHYKDVPANDIDFGLYTKEAMSDGKGGTIAADTLVSVKTVKKGQANTVENLPAGNYYLKELSTKDHLEDNNFRYEVTYAIQGNDPLVVVQANKGEAIKNYYVERPFEFTKKDVSDGMLIPGVTVNVYDETGENIIFTGKTNENGEITITLPAGKYFYQEVDAPAPYLCPDDLYPFEITKDNKVTQALMTDEMAMGNIRLHKAAEDRNNYTIDASGKVNYKEKDLEGAEYAVKAAEDIVTPEGVVKAFKGDTVAHMVTDKKGEATITEAFFMTKEGAAARMTEDTEKPDVKSEGTETPGTDKPDTEAKAVEPMDLTKVDETSTVPVKSETALFLGSGTAKYDVVETKAPDGYRLDETIHTVELSFKDNKTPLVEVELECFNEAKGGDIVLYKEDSEAKTALPNAEISVMDADQKVIFKGKSDEQGNLKIGKLPDGQHFYQETKAPEGYVLDSTIYELKVVDHETTTATLGNVKEKIPDTGIDSNNSPLYIGLIGGAALVCAITLGVHNRRKAKR
ncbi:SpaA isopeptide-forming pilin-related protein [Eubacterium callanderi]|uniref:SpaA isopeptide-forming pilin-related protein n=1 Tax=Eubacterium callanderi TaxID=53442 RepID=UPI0026726C61|nr:SpaA isopeptide-forming pilin-related protein [Eubacterium callanderi]